MHRPLHPLHVVLDALRRRGRPPSTTASRIEAAAAAAAAAALMTIRTVGRQLQKREGRRVGDVTWLLSY